MWFVLLVVIFGACFSDASRYLCYTGSVLYQNTIEDCADKDPSYTGTWYCAKVEVCEPFINRFRECIYTRGCATEDQCANGGGVYDSTDLLASNGASFAGMTISTSCCKADSFADDDSTAVDYSTICNSGSSSGILTVLSIVVSVLGIIYLSM